MKKLLLFLLFFLIHFMTFAQETKKYSIEFSKVDLKTAIDLIEKKTNLVAFYDIDWISKSTIIIESNFTNATLEDILEGVFSKTDLNYFLTENKIIFTKNSIIYHYQPTKIKIDHKQAC